MVKYLRNDQLIVHAQSKSAFLYDPTHAEGMSVHVGSEPTHKCRNAQILSVLSITFSVGEDHPFCGNLLSVGNERVEIHSRTEGLSVDRGGCIATVGDIELHHLRALHVIHIQRGGRHRLGDHE